MQYALISDIHANLPALDAVLAEIDRRGIIGATYHLGDLVGYAPWPDEVVARLIERGIPGIAGNYDSTVATDYRHCGCKYEDPHQEELSHVSYAWTRANVSATTKEALARLPFRIDIKPLGGHTSGPTLILVHGTPVNNVTYWTEDRPDAFSATMATLANASVGDLIAFGHTHQPWHRVIEGVHFLNTGSVGRPKDGDPRAGFAVVTVDDSGAIDVDFVRVEYDVERAARAIIDSDLPNDFADHVRYGGSLPATA